ncbi:hypothetical protein F5883DRAFT_639628 [Diaporthe sp. PMI_573]|nr:hypothetical protein F5883DRAFT_639628 [Diaporthaceae sp. PMI_573]
MGDNSSSADGFIYAPEVGWQAGPLARGAASILWNCISVIILITWTSFHPPVGINWRQRITTTITATLIPELSTLVAARDHALAMDLDLAFKSHQDRPEWREGWNMTKSFLVVKGGIRALTHQIRLFSDSSCAQPVNMTAEEETVEKETVEETAYETLDAETFLILVLQVFYSCTAALVLSQHFVQGGVFNLRRFVEVLVFDWIIYGVMAVPLWWECPKNINLPYCIPVHDHSMSDEESPDGDAEVPVQFPLDTVPPSPDLESGDDMSFEHEPRMVSYHTCLHNCDFGSGSKNAAISVATKLVSLAFVLVFYQWHSTPQTAFWITFFVLSMLSEIVIGATDTKFSFDWGNMNLYETYIRPLMSEHLGLRGESRLRGKLLGLSKDADCRNTTDSEPRKTASRRNCQNNRLGWMVAATFVGLLCHLGKIAIALTAFISAPDRIYNVPDVWILEVLGHVGG